MALTSRSTAANDLSFSLLEAITSTADAGNTGADAVLRCLQCTMSALGWEIGHAFIVEGSGQSRALVSMKTWCDDERRNYTAFQEASFAGCFPEGKGLPGIVLHTGEPLWNTSLAHEPKFLRQAAAAASGLKSMAMFPLKSGSEVIAALEFFAADVVDVDDTTLSVMKLVGQYLGRTLEREKYVRSLANAESRLRRIIQEMPVMMSAIDMRGKLAVWNKECERITGYHADEMIGNSDAAALLYPDPDYRQFMVNEWRRGKGLYRDLEFELTCKDGSKRIIAWSSICSDHPVEEWSQWDIGVDVTERVMFHRHMSDTQASLQRLADEQNHELIKANERLTLEIRDKRIAEERSRLLEKEMAHAWRLNTLNQLAADLAHELNQPLTAVVNYVKAIAVHLTSLEVDKKQEGVIDAALRAAQAAETEAQRAGTIMHGLRDFVAKREFKRVKRSLSEVVGWIIEVVKGELKGNGIKAVIDVPANLPQILIDVVGIQQVFLNLVRNAMDALLEVPTVGRQLRIEAQPATASSEGFVTISVSDTGCGMNAELLSRIFCPFVTTKKTGMGIGLSISKTIVEAHGGRMEVFSTLGSGSRFCVALPYE